MESCWKTKEEAAGAVDVCFCVSFVSVLRVRSFCFLASMFALLVFSLDFVRASRVACCMFFCCC